MKDKAYTKQLRDFSGAIDDFKFTVNELHQELSGTLRIGIFDKTLSNPNAFLPEAFSTFGLEAPGVKLEIYVEPLNDIETGVLNERLHLGIVPSIKEVSGLAYSPLFDEKVSLYCSANDSDFQKLHSISNQEIHEKPYAGLGYFSPNMSIGQSLGLEKAATAYDQEAVALLIMSGNYVGFLPEHYAQTFENQRLIRRIDNEQFSYSCNFKAVVKNSASLARPAQLLLKCLQDAHF